METLYIGYVVCCMIFGMWLERKISRLKKLQRGKEDSNSHRP